MAVVVVPDLIGHGCAWHVVNDNSLSLVPESPMVCSMGQTALENRVDLSVGFVVDFFLCKDGGGGHWSNSFGMFANA